MKKLIFTLLFSIPVLAQHGFRAENGTIIWEKSFPVGNANVMALIEAQKAMTIGLFMDNVVKGDAMDMKIEGDGGSGLMKNNCKFDFFIAVESDHYTVRVKNFKFLEKMGPMQMRTVANSWEKYFLDERKIRPTPITQGNLQFLDNFLTGVFTGTITSSGAITAN